MTTVTDVVVHKITDKPYIKYIPKNIFIFFFPMNFSQFIFSVDTIHHNLLNVVNNVTHTHTIIFLNINIYFKILNLR